jgi:hypothetical protein
MWRYQPSLFFKTASGAQPLVGYALRSDSCFRKNVWVITGYDPDWLQLRRVFRNNQFSLEIKHMDSNHQREINAARATNLSTYSPSSFMKAPQVKLHASKNHLEQPALALPLTCSIPESSP